MNIITNTERTPTMTMTTNDRAMLMKRFEEIAHEATGDQYSDTHESSEIGALGLDSIALLEVVAALEDELDVYLADEILARIEKVGDLIDAVQAA